VNRLDTGLSLVDLNTVGAGGGSICQLDDQGLPQAGPHSAGAVPGPACYDRGGQEPCITDVAAALNLIDPDYFLGGAVKLAPELARKALQGRIAGPLGISAEDAAAGLYDLIVSNMSDAVRAISVERGHDPREFKLVSYGGAASLYIAAIAADLGISQVIIPNRASVFSAQGLLMSDYRRNAVQTVNWNLAKGDISELNGTFNALSAQVREELERSGFQAGDVTLAWDGDFKFGTQVYELTIPIPVGELKETDKPGMAQRFITEYERLYGEGASWENAENLIMLLNVRVTGTAATVKPGFVEYPVVTDGAERASAGERMVYIPSKREKREIPVYRDERFEPGMTVSGNCVIESKDTTIYVPADVTANMDTYRNYVLSL
jgi:N-methylhydantoinase A